MGNSMIFHHPFPLPETAISGSRVRLTSMLEAFTRAGYNVEVVAGYAQERKRRIERVRKEAKKGRQFAFVYSESSTHPIPLAKRNLHHPILDYRFFGWCRKQSIPVGLFYRDVHWRFDQIKVSMPWYKRMIATPLYWYDWIMYLQFVDHLFLPSLAMKSALPSRWPEDRMSALFPGTEIVTAEGELPSTPESNDRLHLFYVGGVKPPLYDLRPLFDAVDSLDKVQLTVCCRDFEWEEVQSYYAPIAKDKVHIIHVSGEDLRTYYESADVFALIWKPNPYLGFAMPVKLFETLGHAVPVMTTAETEVARFVAQEDIGWVVQTKAELRSLLARLRDNRDLIASKRARMLEIREQHTWQARAETVASILISN